MKQSGVSNVRWNAQCQAWSVDFPTYNQQGREVKERNDLQKVLRQEVHGQWAL